MPLKTFEDLQMDLLIPREIQEFAGTLTHNNEGSSQITDGIRDGNCLLHLSKNSTLLVKEN